MVQSQINKNKKIKSRAISPLNVYFCIKTKQFLHNRFMRKLLFFAIILALVCFQTNLSLTFSQTKISVVGRERVYDYSLDEFLGFCYEIDCDKINLAVEKIKKKERVEPKNAEIEFNQNAKDILKIKKEENGFEVDEKKLYNDFLSAVTLGGGAITVNYNQILPSVYSSDLQKFTYERARYTTYYYSSKPERISNIKLATKKISGVKIENGSVFSFNKVVGRRTEENGYKYAPIIKNGRFEDGIGGGVCQVSTTLYNALLLSGLEILEVHPHSLAVSYVENSFDAMVSDGFADLKFKNQTGGPIFIAGFSSDNNVTFIVFGKEQIEEIKKYSETLEVVNAIDELVYNPNLKIGEKVVVTKSKKGYLSRGYLIVKNGDLVEKRLIREDKYLPLNGVIEYGNDVKN